MKKKLIAHEAPLCYMEKVREITDYDYCLVHLLETNPEYFKFFKESLKMGRRVILDNSIFELEEAFDSDKFADWVIELRPTEYIVPDVLDNCYGTIYELSRWIENYADLPGKVIGVVQGQTYEDIVKCYKSVDSVCDKIAISFDYSFYGEFFPHSNKYISNTMGRVFLLIKLLQEGIINKEKPHHLLGCSLPWEFEFYKYPEFDFIESIDTSNPVILGLEIRNYEGWQYEKIETKLIKYFNYHFDKYIWVNIDWNIKKFQNFVI